MAESGCEIGSVIECPICLEALKSPKLLPCLHSFCGLCIRTYIESFILDCNRNKNEVSIECPVCRIIIKQPFNGISAEEWANELPNNHSLSNPCQENTKEKRRHVFCDSCWQNNEKVVAKSRCKECRDNLCETCCRFIHERVKTFACHTIVDLRMPNKDIESTVEFGCCAIHSHKPIDVYCFNHEKLGCSFCLNTEHKDCDTVLSVEEIAENDIDTPMKNIVKQLNQMRDSTKNAIQNAKTSLHKITEQKQEILSNMSKQIEGIRQRLDSLESKLHDSLENNNEKEISDMTFVAEILIDFKKTLEESESIASTGIQTEKRKKLFIAMKKSQHQIFDHLKSLKSAKNKFKTTTLKGTHFDEKKLFSNLTKLGDFEYSVEKIDIVTTLQRQYFIMKNDIHPKEIVSCAQLIKEIHCECGLNRLSTGFNTGDAIVSLAIDIRDSSWSVAFSTKHDWFNVLVHLWDCSYLMHMTGPSSLLLNPDKSFKAFGSDAENQVNFGKGQELENYYYFRRFATEFYSKREVNQQTKLKDVFGKELRATEVFELSFEFLFRKFSTDVTDCPEVSYVIILPTHRNVNSIQNFMMKVLKKCGIPSSSLKFVSETEAIFIYHHKTVEDTDAFHGKYIVVVLEDKCSTLAVCNKGKDGLSNEVLKISSGPWGLQTITNEFETFITKVVGEEQMQKFKSEHCDMFEVLMRDFLETFLHHKGPHQRSCCIKFPFGYLSFNLEESVKLSSNFKIQRFRDKIEFKREEFVKFGDKVTRKVTEHIKTISGDMTDVECIVLVGRLSNSVFVQNAVRELFNTKRIVALDSIDVIKGAVYMGHML